MSPEPVKQKKKVRVRQSPLVKEIYPEGLKQQS